MSLLYEPHRLISLRLGDIAPLGAESLPSAIDKRPVSGRVALSALGLAGDNQADRVHHGGPDKALHVYPAEHYLAWREQFPAQADLFGIGGFGENLATHGLREDNVCLGDIFRLGDARVQVSQGRSPCRKLNLRFARPDMPEQVLASGRTGWYFRVIETGTVGPGDDLTLVERHDPAWPIDRLVRALFGATPDPAALRELAGHPRLAANWRERAARRLMDV